MSSSYVKCAILQLGHSGKPTPSPSYPYMCMWLLNLLLRSHFHSHQETCFGHQVLTYTLFTMLAGSGDLIQSLSDFIVTASVGVLLSSMQSSHCCMAK